MSSPGCMVDMNKRSTRGTRGKILLVPLVLLVFLAPSFCLLMVSAFGGAQEYPALDLGSIPISNWLDGGEHADVPWDFGVRDANLRIDQRLEISYLARIDAKDLNRTGK